MRYSNFVAVAIAIAVSLIFTFTSSHGADTIKWVAVRKSAMTGGISGMAGLGDGRFLIVHDNKQPADDRVAVIEFKGGSAKPRYHVVPWPTGSRIPVDLEGLTSVPGTSNTTFLAVESSGGVTEFALTNNATAIKIVKEFRLPMIETNDNYEGLTLYKADDRIVALWAHRGGNTSAAKLRWGMFDLNAGVFSGVNTTNIKVPWPNKNDVRPISDIVVDANGSIVVSSASDGGNDGPFASALYRLGKFTTAKDGAPAIEFEPTPVQLYRAVGYKIEGIALVEGGFAVGTDDENKGSFFCIVKTAGKTRK